MSALLDCRVCDADVPGSRHGRVGAAERPRQSELAEVLGSSARQFLETALEPDQSEVHCPRCDETTVAGQSLFEGWARREGGWAFATHQIDPSAAR